MIVVGSYVSKTTRQLAQLQANSPALQPCELNVDALLSDSNGEVILSAMEQVNAALANGQDAVLHTSREYVSQGSAEKDLEAGKRISDSIVQVVSCLQVEPAFLIAKGGITSSDVATKGLNVSRAAVLGQILPGVPVWKLGGESRFPGMGYVVFPGNVGDDEALLTAYQILGAS